VSPQPSDRPSSSPAPSHSLVPSDSPAESPRSSQSPIHIPSPLPSPKPNPSPVDAKPTPSPPASPDLPVSPNASFHPGLEPALGTPKDSPSDSPAAQSPMESLPAKPTVSPSSGPTHPTRPLPSPQFTTRIVPSPEPNPLLASDPMSSPTPDPNSAQLNIGGSCLIAEAVVLNPSHRTATQTICSDLQFYNVSLDFGTQWGPFDSIWVGARACGSGCNTTVSVLHTCDKWHSTGASCGGTVVQMTNSSWAGVLIAVRNLGGSCCSPVGLNCCFGVTIAAAAWLPPTQPPRACCSN